MPGNADPPPGSRIAVGLAVFEEGVDPFFEVFAGEEARKRGGVILEVVHGVAGEPLVQETLGVTRRERAAFADRVREVECAVHQLAVGDDVEDVADLLRPA